MPESAMGIAILGAGIFAKEAHLPSIAALGDAAPLLRAVYSRSEKSSVDFATAAAEALKLPSPPTAYHDGDKSLDLDALLARSDITAVIIMLPITLQPSIVLKALAAGKHVLSEKPVAPDVTSGRSLIATYLKEYKPKGLIWRVAENFEAEPGYRAAAKAIRDGKIGRVAFFNCKVYNHVDKNSKWYKTPWRTIPDYQGGFLLDGGVHTVAALRTILPQPLTHLTAFASLNQKHLPPHDTIHALIKSSSNFQGIIELTFAAPTPSRPVTDGIVVTGTEGWLSLSQVNLPNGNSAIRITIKSTSIVDGKSKEVEEVIEEEQKGVLVELASFFNAMEGKDDGLGLGDPQAALADVAFVEAALNSDGALVELLAPN